LWELIVTETARKAGVPTIEILAAIRRRVFWPIYKGDLVSKEIPDSLDLIQWLTRRKKPGSRKTVRDKRELIRQAGRLVRQIHEVGIYHRDLHLKNFVVKVEGRGAGSLHIIDFDRSAIVHPLTSDKWWANLMRLDRSIEKWQPRGIWITRTDRLRFLRSYLEGDQERRALVKTYLRKYPQRRRKYAIGWALERLLYG
jgi:tRNA A-37 threonylcarbamoyl transferase component Bud32